MLLLLLVPLVSVYKPFFRNVNSSLDQGKGCGLPAANLAVSRGGAGDKALLYTHANFKVIFIPFHSQVTQVLSSLLHNMTGNTRRNGKPVSKR